MTVKHSWWWVSFADPHRPKGEQFVGAVIVTAPEEAHAGLHGRAIVGMRYDHAELLIGKMPAEFGDPPPAYVGRLLSRKEAEVLAAAWPPGGRLATPDEVRAAILDDNAEEGNPLFAPTPVGRHRGPR